MATKGQTIIKKIEVVEGHGHHGGAWKVAYADFMTAMMAFFLLMWILSSSDEQKLRGIAEYFTDATMPGGSGVLDGATLGPPGTLNASNGATVARGSDRGAVDDPTPASWEVLDVTQAASPEEEAKGTNIGQQQNIAGGQVSEIFVQDISDTGLSDAGASSVDTVEKTFDDASDNPQVATGETSEGASDAQTEALDPNSKFAGANAAAVEEQNALHTEDKERFEALEAEIQQAMQDSPELGALKDSLVFKETEEGMLVQIMDQEGKPMFASGKAKMNQATLMLMEKLGEGLAKLPNDMIISGHTDAVPFANQAAYDNWDLSSDRANAMRRVLVANGVTRDRITRVSGLADTELLKEDAPRDASNRRIEVLLAYRAPMIPKTPTEAEVAEKMEKAPAPADAPAPAPTPKVAETVAEVEPTPTVATTVVPAKVEATVLDEQVFENLRSALR